MVLSAVYDGSAYPESAVFIQIAHILSPFWLLYPIQAHRFIVHVVPFSLIFFLKRIIKQILFSPCKRDIPARTGTLVHLSVPRLFFPASATGQPKAPGSHTIPDSETWFPQYPSAPGTVLMIRSCMVQRMGKKISCSAEIFNNLFGEK